MNNVSVEVLLVLFIGLPLAVWLGVKMLRNR